ncbi:hypothetical protein ARAM_000352 [Aspergillus rambellii]|uniref:Alpha-1,3-glucanase/mutanase n=2 Tax=Aspergillus subgen. Nidulantes TaxID=2720870 RepID=A0A0F8VCA3_9EURO|nr:hypothetical protein ARAM_000352 [Aspergillus rambellii]
MLSLLLSLLAVVIPGVVHARSIGLHTNHIARTDNSSRLVFAHFMIGVVSNRGSASDYDDDMKRAKSLGIDAFALNIGVDPYTDAQLQLAYQSAANNEMKVFISFDFNWWHADSQAAEIGQKIKQYAALPAQLKVDGKTFVSSFAGDQLDVATMRSSAGEELFFAPNFHPEMKTDFSKIDGALNWMAWPNNGNNKAPDATGNVTVQEGDQAYLKALGDSNYIAPVSPWFSTHFGPEVSYSKNWVFPSDILWFERWNEILQLKPRFIEVVSWNDYGESHYIGPLHSPHTDDGSSKWVNDMPHGGWMDMAKPFISAYHDGAETVDKYITNNEIYYWYRRTPRNLNCDATDTTMQPANNQSGNYFEGRPNGWETMTDSVFVVTMLTKAGSLTVTSGNHSKTFDAGTGANVFSVDMGLGKQSFSLTRASKTVLSGDSPMDIADVCPCGLYNFNAYVGSLPSQAPDALQSTGLQAFMQGLKVSTCLPTPTLGASTRSAVAQAIQTS